MNKQQAAEALADLEKTNTPLRRWGTGQLSLTCKPETYDAIKSALQSVLEAGEQTTPQWIVDRIKQNYETAIQNVDTTRDADKSIMDHYLFVQDFWEAVYRMTQQATPQPLSDQTAQPDVMGAVENLDIVFGDFVGHLTAEFEPRRPVPEDIAYGISEVKQAIAALRSPGMVSVPMEPTEEMLLNGLMAFVEGVVKRQKENPIDETQYSGNELAEYKACRMGQTLHNSDELTTAYKAMIAARPKS